MKSPLPDTEAIRAAEAIRVAQAQRITLEVRVTELETSLEWARWAWHLGCLTVAVVTLFVRGCQPAPGPESTPPTGKASPGGYDDRAAERTPPQGVPGDLGSDWMFAAMMKKGGRK